MRAGNLYRVKLASLLSVVAMVVCGILVIHDPAGSWI